MSSLISVNITEKQPILEPVTLSELKEWLRIEEDFTEEDDLITSLGIAARKRIERFLGLVLVDSHIKGTYIQHNDGNRMEIFYGPVSDDDMGSNGFIGSPLAPYLDTCSSKEVLEYDSTWGSEGCPDWAKMAIKMEVAFRYENRGDGSNGFSTSYMSENLREGLTQQVIDYIYSFRNTIHEYIF